MNHSWKKNISGKTEIHRRMKRPESKIRIHTVNGIQECVKCGLRKGYEKVGEGWKSYYTLIYFVNDEFLSFDTLPYSCCGQESEIQSLLFSKEDFKI